MSDIQAQLAQWKAFFAKHGIHCDVDQIPIPPNPFENGRLLVVPQGLQIKEICGLFKSEFESFGVWCCFGPIKLLEWAGGDDRSSENASYVLWVKSHVTVSPWGISGCKLPDEQMTLAEAFMYHLMMLHIHGEEYLDPYRFSGFHHCRGTRKSARGMIFCPILRWDLWDIKICLDSWEVR